MKRFFLCLLLSTLIYSLGAQVKVPIPTDADYKTSNVLAVYDGDTRIATICREYIVNASQNVTTIADVLYLSNPDGSTNYAFGYDLGEAAHYNWDLAKNQCTLHHPDLKYEGLYITSSQMVSYSILAEARQATLKTILLTDRRGDETISYGIVKVGSQLWMRENLATLRWRDGSAIETGLAKDLWWKTGEAAVCYYNDDSSLLASHGALYNFFAVADPRGLAPQGWSVPTDEEWHSMIGYVDPNGFEPDPDDLSRESQHAGLLLKSPDGWTKAAFPEPGAVLKQGNNLTGFNARPCGSTSKSKYMDYSAEGLQAYFWTSSTYEEQALFRRFYWDADIANRFYESKNFGYSVRCMKPATQVQIIHPTPQTAEGVQVESRIDAKTPFVFRAISQSGEIVVSDAAGAKHTFTVDDHIDQLMGGVGTLVSLPASKDNNKLIITGPLLYLDLSGQAISRCSIEHADKLQALILNNNQLSELTLPGLPSLRLLYAHSNEIQHLSLGSMPQLTELILMSNQLTTIDLSQLPALQQLGIAMNQLSEIDLSQTPSLQGLDCQRNKLKQLEEAALSQLKALNCSKNKISTLQVAPLTQLEKLYCSDNKLSTLDIAPLNNLSELNCSNNEISVLDLKGKSALVELYAFTNKLTELNLSDATKLTTISLGDNQLSQLTLVNMEQLESISAPFNKLSKLTLKACPALRAVSVFANELTGVSITECPSIALLEIHNNRIAEPLPLVESLPPHPDMDEDPGYLIFFNTKEYADIPEGNIKSDELITAAKKKGWYVLDGETPLVTHISEVTPQHPIRIVPIDECGRYQILGVEPTLWQVYTPQGLLVETGSQAQEASSVIDLSALPHGTYLVRLFDDNDRAYSCLIVR